MSTPAVITEGQRTGDSSGKVTVLCVDDEPQVLAGLSLNLARRYNLLTATSGFAAIKVLQANTDVAVIISDMRMPVMDGATFLKRARELAPDAVRMLLTGQADVDSAISAVNEGQVFRFLTKPCSMVRLLSIIQAAVDHHRLVTAEKVLLEQTLRGSITALMDVLSLTNPVSFGRAARIKAYASGLAHALSMPDPWQVEVAAMLSQLGYISLPHETMEKLEHGQALSMEEADMVARVPSVSEQLVAHIPRLEVVRGMLAALADPHRKPPVSLTPVQERQIRRGVQVLRAAMEVETRESQRASESGVPPMVSGGADPYEPELLEALRTVREARLVDDIREIALTDLEVGMIFVDDVRMEGGTLLVARGCEVTPGMVARGRNIRKGSVTGSVRVRVPRRGTR